MTYHLCVIPNPTRLTELPFSRVEENHYIGKFKTNIEFRQAIDNYFIERDDLMNTTEIFRVNKIPKTDKSFLKILKNRRFIKLYIIVNGSYAAALVAYWGDD